MSFEVVWPRRPRCPRKELGEYFQRIFEISRFHWSKCTIEYAIYSILILKSAQARCDLLPFFHLYSFKTFTFFTFLSMHSSSNWEIVGKCKTLKYLLQGQIFSSAFHWFRKYIFEKIIRVCFEAAATSEKKNQWVFSKITALKMMSSSLSISSNSQFKTSLPE